MTVREDPSPNTAGFEKNSISVQSPSAGGAAAAAPAREKPEPSSGVIPAPASTAKALPGMEKLGAGLREMVKAELQAAGLRVGKLEDTAPAAKPDRWDVVFLLVGVVNVAFLVWMVPVATLNDERIKFLKELVPWVFGGLFVLVTSWFHGTILTLSRNRIFRIIDIILVLVLAGLMAPLVALPVLLPTDAYLSVGDENADPIDLTKTYRVSLLKEHTYYLNKEYEGEPLPYKRHFKATGWDIWQERLNNSQLSWSLLYPVKITAPRGIQITITREESAFDQSFLGSENLGKLFLRKTPDTKDQSIHAVQFLMPKTVDIETTRLPMGRYRLQSDSRRCKVKVCDAKQPDKRPPDGCKASPQPDSLRIDLKDQIRYAMEVTCQ